jgi:endogenous inhibitor of DNA gyrase (YacG/DUF329 family)
MTNDNNIFKKFSDIITSYQDSPKLGGNIPHSNNNSRCLNCKQPLVNTNFSPFCGAIYLGAWNSERAKDAKGSEKNTMLGFSEIFRQ